MVRFFGVMDFFNYHDHKNLYRKFGTFYHSGKYIFGNPPHCKVSGDALSNRDLCLKPLHHQLSSSK